MIRIVSIASLLAMLVLVTYLPSVYPAERFVAQLMKENDANAVLWGKRHAMAILERMLDLQESATQTNPASQPSQPSPGLDGAVATQIESVNHRLFHNAYFRSIDALLALASYRICAVVEWLQMLMVFIAAVLIDGFLLRIIKAKEFLQHNPEKYALYLCGAIMASCGMIILLVVPMTLPPLLFPLVLAVTGLFLSRALANFHRRG
jgi:hypothetical protein